MLKPSYWIYPCPPTPSPHPTANNNIPKNFSAASFVSSTCPKELVTCGHKGTGVSRGLKRGEPNLAPLLPPPPQRNVARRFWARW
jgi:hypothetical protein